MAEEALIGLIILEVLEDAEKRLTVRGKTRKWIKRRQEQGLYHNLVKELRLEDTKGYNEMMRMSYPSFEFLLTKIEKDITPMELEKGGLKPISPAERLTLTLRFLATGESFRSLSFQFRISKSAISYIVQEVCKAIITNLASTYLKVPSTKNEWMQIAKQFYDRWNFPNALGAIDGKHITIQKPAGGGSFYYNYKHTHSVVLMAVAGPNYECLYADVGANGRCSDGGIWGNSSIAKLLDDDKLSVPGPRKLPDSDRTTPFVLLGDDAFALKMYLMKPFPQRGLTDEKRVYNYRHSRARRISENLFGIISNRWRVLRAPILLAPESVKNIVMAILVLHNYLRQSSSNGTYCPPGLTDVEDSTGFAPGYWRDDEETTQTFFNLGPRQFPGNAQANAKEVRNTFADYFVNEGQVYWQWEKC